ncbi:MAG: Ig-like domain-containing protein [Planctomycetota bacterium]
MKSLPKLFQIPLCLALSASIGCERGPDQFRILEVIPAATAGELRLNQPLTIVFSRNVDPSSVSSDALGLRLADGRRGRGRLLVSGARVEFHPGPVRSAGLADGGYGRGGGATLKLRGFPDRDGVLSADGEPLASTIRIDLRIVEVGEPADRLFLDLDGGASPRLLNRLKPVGEEFARVRPMGKVRLIFSEPLHPASVTSRTIRMLFDNPDRDPVDIALDFRQEESRAVVDLCPVDGFLQDGTRYLLVLGGEGVRDLAGHGYDPSSLQEVRIRVDPEGEAVLGERP